MCDSPFVLTPQAVWIACNNALNERYLRGIWFQYRKRYGLHAIAQSYVRSSEHILFQYRKRYGLHAIRDSSRFPPFLLVSIPQAVWIACNVVLLATMTITYSFQYRKRYGLHAILSVRYD